MAPLDTLPIWHLGSLRAHARDKGGEYGAGLLRTAELLEAAGVVEPRSYELHMPMAVDKAGWRVALGPKKTDERLAPRSIYGNLAELGGELHEDTKIYNREGFGFIAAGAGPFLSSTDISFLTLAPTLRRTFPDPGPYERAR